MQPDDHTRGQSGARLVPALTVGENNLDVEMSISHPEQQPHVVDLVSKVSPVHSLFHEFKHFGTPTIVGISR